MSYFIIIIIIKSQKLGFSRVSRVNMVRVKIRVSVRIRVRFIFSGVKLYETRGGVADRERG